MVQDTAPDCLIYVLAFVNERVLRPGPTQCREWGGPGWFEWAKFYKNAPYKDRWSACMPALQGALLRVLAHHQLAGIPLDQAVKRVQFRDSEACALFRRMDAILLLTDEQHNTRMALRAKYYKPTRAAETTETNETNDATDTEPTGSTHADREPDRAEEGHREADRGDVPDGRHDQPVQGDAEPGPGAGVGQAVSHPDGHGAAHGEQV